MSKCYDFKKGGICYQINDDNETVQVTFHDYDDNVDYDCNGYNTHYNYPGNLEIPSSVTYEGKNYPVTNIRDHAFYTIYELTSVTIPESVTSIGDCAFSGCSSLTSVTFNATNCTEAGSRDYPVFRGCNKLGVTIGNKVQTIPTFLFSGCGELTRVIFNAANCIEAGSRDYPVFRGCNKLEVTIGNKVQTIPTFLFCCSGLTKVTIGNSVTSIGDCAFSNCSILTKVTIGNSVTSIGDCAFSDCSSLTKVTIPNSVTSIGNFAFSDCSSLTSVTIPNSVTSIGNRAFSDCTGLTSITIPNSVTEIGILAFSWCSGLTSINVESGNPNYISIDGILYDKDVITVLFCPIGKTGEVTIPNSVTSIGDDAFFGCSGLTSITIPNSTSIGTNAFFCCSSLTSVICKAKEPPTCDSDVVFSGCYNATLYVPKGTAQAYRNVFERKNFKNIVEMDMENDDNTTAVEALAEEAFSAYAASGTVYCSAEEFQIFTINGTNVTTQNGNLPAGVYVVVGEKGRCKVVVK